MFETPGVYETRLAVTDDSGARCGTASDVARVWVNAPPVAVAGGDRDGFVGGAYDQSCSMRRATDADGEPLSFLWDLGDGVTRSGAKVQHAYTEPASMRSASASPTAPGWLRPDLGRNQGLGAPA